MNAKIDIVVVLEPHDLLHPLYNQRPKGKPLRSSPTPFRVNYPRGLNFHMTVLYIKTTHHSAKARWFLNPRARPENVNAFGLFSELKPLYITVIIISLALSQEFYSGWALHPPCLLVRKQDNYWKIDYHWVLRQCYRVISLVIYRCFNFVKKSTLSSLCKMMTVFFFLSFQNEIRDQLNESWAFHRKAIKTIASYDIHVLDSHNLLVYWGN